ncbi:MAG: type II secretion system protein [Patescibacteria group bacterium]
MNFQFSNRINDRGFTLIEVIVVVAVMGFLSASILSSQKSSSARRQLGLDVQRAVQDLRNAQNLALSSQVSVDCSGKVVPYGIVFNTALSDRYLLVADCNQNNAYDSGDAIVQTVFFPESRINSLQAEGVGVGSLQIFFTPPLPAVFVNGVVPVSVVPATSATLCHFKQTALCKTISISSKGAISTQ